MHVYTIGEDRGNANAFVGLRFTVVGLRIDRRESFICRGPLCRWIFRKDEDGITMLDGLDRWVPIESFLRTMVYGLLNGISDRRGEI